MLVFTEFFSINNNVFMILSSFIRISSWAQSNDLREATVADHQTVKGQRSRPQCSLTNQDDGSAGVFPQEVVEEVDGAAHGQVLESQSFSMEEFQNRQAVFQPGDPNRVRNRETWEGFMYECWRTEETVSVSFLFHHVCFFIQHQYTIKLHLLSLRKHQTKLQRLQKIPD